MHHGVGDGEKEENIDYRASFRLVRELMRTRLGGFALAFLFLIFATAVNLVNPVIAKTILDSVIPAHDSTRLVVYSVMYAANIFLSLVFNYLLYIQLVKTGQKLIVSLKKKLLDHLFTLGMDFYSENPVGKLSARVQSDTGTLYELFTETAVTIFKDIFMFIAVFVIMFFYNRELTMLLMPVFPVILLIVWLFVKLSSPLFVKSRKIMAEIIKIDEKTYRIEDGGVRIFLLLDITPNFTALSFFLVFLHCSLYLQPPYLAPEAFRYFMENLQSVCL